MIEAGVIRPIDFEEVDYLQQPPPHTYSNVEQQLRYDVWISFL